MTTHPENEQVSSESSLLTAQEQAICKQIAAREAPHSQRALALLALSEKSTQAQAAQKAGLSIGQVKYWAAKFRKQRLGIFPEIQLEEPKAEAGEATVLEIEKAPEVITEKADPAEEKPVEPKVKKGKKTKQTNKDKKRKKGKKIKKTAGKTKKPKKSKKSKKAKVTKKGKKGKKTKKATGKTKKEKKGKKSKKSK